MRAGCCSLLRQPSQVEISSTPVGFAALAHARCALVGQFTLSINVTALADRSKVKLRLAQTPVNNQYLSTAAWREDRPIEARELSPRFELDLSRKRLPKLSPDVIVRSIN